METLVQLFGSMMPLSYHCIDRMVVNENPAILILEFCPGQFAHSPVCNCYLDCFLAK